jgi:predicted phage-related endonuclease
MSDQPWRRDALGASDAPALVGVDPWRTAGDVWCEKTGRLPAEESAASTGSLDVRALGSAIAPLLLDVASARLGLPFAREVWFQHPTRPLACSVDGLALGDGILCEAKTVGLLGRSPLLDLYGEPGTDDVPDAVKVQLAHSFAVLDAQPDVPPVRVAFVVALLGGRGVQVYRVERDDGLVCELAEYETDWWADHVTADRCPAPELPSLPVLKRMRRQPDAPAVPLDVKDVAAWLEAKELVKAAEQTEEEMRRVVLSALGDGEHGSCLLGHVSYKASKRAAYTVAAQTVRTLRFTATKEAKRHVA